MLMLPVSKLWDYAGGMTFTVFSPHLCDICVFYRGNYYFYNEKKIFYKHSYDIQYSFNCFFVYINKHGIGALEMI